MHKIFFLAPFTAVSLVSAQKLTQENVTGFWKLKEAGFYEDQKKVVKEFDNCRLMRNYAIREDGFAIYNYIEGKSGDCRPSEPRLSFWRIVDNRIQFYVDDQNILEEVEVTINKDHTITFSSYIPEQKKLNRDAFSEKIANTVHYDILEKQF
ncbi:lipocalin family protein [Chryseobacterium sp. RU33C]|uniref:lipocalin family protein n=1 Tax=Chryseobacterium sp. RU33C TaxID=1907398 RepID=UPI000953F287|nr:lipocalin family protein [Chryseobacterium sp. RU33C]SIR70685.1 Lipocalin-like domain-containing protein [Chryseobacterium sp. RU33C]